MLEVYSSSQISSLMDRVRTLVLGSAKGAETWLAWLNPWSPNSGYWWTLNITGSWNNVAGLSSSPSINPAQAHSAVQGVVPKGCSVERLALKVGGWGSNYSDVASVDLFLRFYSLTDHAFQSPLQEITVKHQSSPAASDAFSSEVFDLTEVAFNQDVHYMAFYRLNKNGGGSWGSNPRPTITTTLLYGRS